VKSAIQPLAFSLCVVRLFAAKSVFICVHPWLNRLCFTAFCGDFKGIWNAFQKFSADGRFFERFSIFQRILVIDDPDHALRF